jgi:putative hydrolase of the HAD superfamily
MTTTLIFDFGGVLINLNRKRALHNFEEIGLLHVAKMLDYFFPVDIFLKFAKGKISNNDFLEHLQKLSTKNPTKEQMREAFYLF